MKTYSQHYIGGRWIDGHGTRRHDVVNPAPRRLTPAQIANYNTRGFIAPLRVYLILTVVRLASPPGPLGAPRRPDVLAVHLRNVDCAAFLGIVRGFEDRTYRPAGPVRGLAGGTGTPDSGGWRRPYARAGRDDRAANTAAACPSSRPCQCGGKTIAMPVRGPGCRPRRQRP